MNAPSHDTVRFQIADMVDECPSRAPHDIALYLMTQNRRYGIIAAIICLTEDNCWANVSDDLDDFVEYITQQAVKHFDKPLGQLAESVVMDTFESVYGTTVGFKAARHYSDWIASDICKFGGGNEWTIKIDSYPETFIQHKVAFVHASNTNGYRYNGYCFGVERQAKHFAAMLSAMSGYPIV